MHYLEGENITELVQSNRYPIVFRGEHGKTNKEGCQTKLPGYSFSSLNVALNYAQNPNDNSIKAINPRIIAANITIKQPALMNIYDPFWDFFDLINKIGELEAKRVAIRHSDAIERTNNWEENYSNDFLNVKELLDKKPSEINNLYCDAYYLLDDFELVKTLLKKGYDGAIHMGNGTSSESFEFRLFSEKQIEQLYSFDLKKIGINYIKTFLNNTSKNKNLNPPSPDFLDSMSP